MHECRCPKTPKEGADALELELQARVSCLTSVLEAKLESIEERTPL